MCLPSGGQPTNKDRLTVLGGGTARAAGEKINDYPAYMRYVTETQANGEAAMSPEEWARTQSQQMRR